MLSLLFQFLLLAGIVGAIAYALSPLFDRESKGPRFTGFLGAFALFVVLFLSFGIHQIDAGHIGVVRNWGAVTNQVLNPGLSWTIPIATSVDDVNTQTRVIRIADDPNTPNYEGYSAASLEQQDLFANITLNYHVDPQQAANIIQNQGSDFESKIVMPRLQSIPKNVTDDYPTATVLNKRQEITDRAAQLLREALAPFGLIVDGLNFENFDYSPEYNAAIEAKQVAQQQVETEKQRLAQAQIAAQTVTAQAKGQADAQIELARGEAESNRLIDASLTQNILINRYIEKVSPTIQTMLVPSENGFILDIGSALAPKPTAVP